MVTKKKVTKKPPAKKKVPAKKPPVAGKHAGHGGLREGGGRPISVPGAVTRSVVLGNYELNKISKLRKKETLGFSAAVRRLLGDKA